MPNPKPQAELRKFGERLRALREDLKLTRKDVARPLGMTETGYSHYEAGRARIAISDLPRLSRALGVGLDQLVARLGLSEPGAVAGVRRIGSVVEVPLIRGVQLSAGTGRGFIFGDDVVRVEAELWREHPDLVALTVSGSCLEPEIADGDTVLLDVGRVDPKDGDRVAVLTPEGELLVKRYVVTNGAAVLRDGQGNELQPNGAQIQGKVVGVYRTYR